MATAQPPAAENSPAPPVAGQAAAGSGTGAGGAQPAGGTESPAPGAAGGGAPAQVSFVCQRCGQPLRLDASLTALDQGTIDELTAPLVSGEEGEGGRKEERGRQDSRFEEAREDGVIRKHIPAARLTSVESGSGFTLIDADGRDNPSHRLKVTSHLFDIMSGQTDVDHPLCEECTDTLLDQLDQQLRIIEDECKDYREFLEKLKLTEDHSTEEQQLESQLNKLKAEEKELMRVLEQVETERSDIAREVVVETAESERLDQEEENRYWQEYGEYKRQLLELEDDQRSVDNQLRYAQYQLDKLRKTNVFNATFHIWHSGHFGTINNFRLGRLPSVPVEWSEINAAWGQTVLLLHSLAKKMNLKFERYRLVPYGNHSFLESLSDKSKELPLYGSGGFRFFWDTKFDQAMVAFLDCLQQFKERVERGDTGFCLPYRMANGKIEDTGGSGGSYSIKIQFNSEEQWTKALKFMLTNLKWGLAWVSSQFTHKP
ncbi:beclin-1-like isoform X2 [Branchiostoma lanceolatum]|uniref:beclin-1-like isoform X1 n=1 Tax=Branchiostoma lanceolatum TaxID=7740 RepID=UPI003455EB2D